MALEQRHELPQIYLNVGGDVNNACLMTRCVVFKGGCSKLLLVHRQHGQIAGDFSCLLQWLSVRTICQHYVCMSICILLYTYIHTLNPVLSPYLSSTLNSVAKVAIRRVSCKNVCVLLALKSFLKADLLANEQVERCISFSSFCHVSSQKNTEEVEVKLDGRVISMFSFST